jgi:hypothetical protein
MKFLILLSVIIPQLTSANGLKVVDYKNETSETKTKADVDARPALSAEDMKKLQEDIQKIKKNQEDQRRFLEQLDNEDN